MKKPLVPGSDGADKVIEVGSSVKQFRVGQKVVTFMNHGPKGLENDPLPLH